MTWDNFLASLGPREKALPGVYQQAMIDCGIQPIEEILEVGSGWGIFSRSVLEGSIAMLTTIDKKIDLDEFEERTKGFETRINRITGDSGNELLNLQYANKTFDLVMVDGDHSYDGCISDLRLSWGMLKQGGSLLIDDVLHPHNFDDDYGVAQALWDFMGSAGVTGFEFMKVGSGGVAVIRKQ